MYTEIDQNDMTYFITYHLKQWKSIPSLKEYIGRKQKRSHTSCKVY
jgi:hypothetical protein